MVNDIEDSIIRPVALQVIRQLAKTLKIPETVNVLYPGPWGESFQIGSTLSTTPIDDPARFKYGERFRIEILERPVEDRVLATAVHRRENEAIFLDKALSVAIYPITVGTQMEINITYRAESRVDARRFRDDILAHVAEGRTDNMHEIDYHYNIPYIQMDLLKEIYELRESSAGYSDTFEDWINAHISQRATNIATQIGTQKKVAIREKQVSALGYFEFTSGPDVQQKDREGASMNIELRYLFTYDQVTGCVAQFPLTFHGQFLNERWYKKPRASGDLVTASRRNRAPSLSRGYFDVISHQTVNWERLQHEMVRVPYFDDWKPEYRLPFTTEFIQAGLGIDPEHPYELFGMMDFDDFVVEPVILEFLRSEAPYACDFKNSIFHCALYEDYNPLADTFMRLQSDLTFVATSPLNPRSQWHTQVSFVHKLGTLSEGARERLRRSGEAGLRILEWLMLKWRGFAYVPELISKRIEHIDDPYGGTEKIPVIRGTIKEEDMVIIEDILDRHPSRRYAHFYPRGIMKTVAQYGIIARRRIPDVPA